MKRRWFVMAAVAMLVAGLALFLTPQTTHASTCTQLGVDVNASNWRTRASGNWTSNAVWQCQGILSGFWYDASSGQYPSNNLDNDNVTIRNGHTVTMVASEGINSLTIDSGGRLNTATYAVTGSTFILSSGGTLGIGSTAGIVSSGSSGNIQTTTRSFSTGGNYVYNGSSAQVTGSGLPATVNNLAIDNTAGVSLSQGATVNGTLTLTNGRLTLGGNTLTIASNNAVGGSPFSASKMVVADGAGALCKAFSANGSFLYPVGDVTSTADYSPATLNFTSGTFGPGTACVRVVDAAHPNGDQTNYPTYITRYWPVTQSGISGFNATATFVYVNDDLVIGSGQSAAALYHWSYSAPNWTLLTQADTANNTLSSNVTSFSDHTARSGSPLAVTLSEFSAAQQGAAVLVSWETNSEIDNRGFNLYRGSSPDGPDQQLNELLIPSQSQGNPGGFFYTWLDEVELEAGATYFYWLEDVDLAGATTLHGPVSVDFTVPTAVTLSSVSANPGVAAMGLSWLWVAAAAGAALGVSRLRRRR